MIDRLESNLAIIEPKNGVKEKLALAEKEGRPLIVKLGFDPTAPNLHLGHAVVLRKLREFQEAGHRVVVIIGDFTASIGDPTGRNTQRPPLSREKIEESCETYFSQLGLLLDIDKVEIRRNSEWLDSLGSRDFIQLLAKVTIAQILQREDFRKRFRSDLPIHTHEILYPILQGYDSVVIGSDIELGGTDQLFNNMMGRTLQYAFGQPGQSVIACPLLIGLDGSEKMSKSGTNSIWLLDSPIDMYGKVMSISDDLITDYLRLVTTFDEGEQDALRAALGSGQNPMDVKKQIAANIVEQFHSGSAAKEAGEHFERTVQKNAPTESDHTSVSIATVRNSFPSGSATLLEICDLVTTDKSRSELRRLIKGGGVKLDGEKVLDDRAVIEIAEGHTLWLGKREKFIFRAAD